MIRPHRILPAAAAIAVLAVLPAAASADGADVKIEDRCDPASFVAALGPGACDPIDSSGSRVVFGDLIDTLVARQSHPKWRFTDPSVDLRRGEALDVRMTRGGEFHTFTEVDRFGKGCVPELNALVFPGQDPSPAAICADPAIFPGTGIAPGGSQHITGLSRGTHRFVCLIHPWMKSTVSVR